MKPVISKLLSVGLLKNIFSPLFFFALGAVSILFVTYTFAHGGDTNLIHACVKTSNGAITIVGANDTCASNETPLDWSQTAGSGGSQFIIIDSQNQEVGALIGIASVARMIGELWVSIPITMNGFLEEDPSMFVFYESADCSGTPLVSPNGIMRTGQVSGANVYYAGNPLVNHYNSNRIFTPPSTYTQCNQESQDRLLGPLQSAVLPAFSPPFTIK